MDTKGNPPPAYGQYPPPPVYASQGVPVAQAYVDNGAAPPEQQVPVAQGYVDNGGAAGLPGESRPPQPASFFGDTPAYIVDGESGFSGYTIVEESCGCAACVGCLASFGLSLCLFPNLLKDKKHINPANNRLVRGVGRWMNRAGAHLCCCSFFWGAWLFINAQVATYKKDPCAVFDPAAVVAKSY